MIKKQEKNDWAALTIWGLIVIGYFLCVVVFWINVKEKKEAWRIEEIKIEIREASEQLNAVLVVDELMRGEETTLSELAATGMIRIDCPAMDQAFTAWLKTQGIDSGGIGGVEALPSPASRQIDAFLNCPIKLPAFQLPVKAEDEKK